MTQEELKEIDDLLANCNALRREMDDQKKGIDFLLEQYRTDKRWFRDEPGKVTTENIIKTCFEFGWSSYRNFLESKKE